VIGTLVVGGAVLPMLALLQPALWRRALWALVALVAICGISELLGRLKHPRAASWWFVLGLVGLITANALQAGGIVSPGIRSMLVFVLIAGVLLGEVAAISVAVLCSLIGLTLAIMEMGGILPAHTLDYSPISQWLLLSLYLGVTVALMRLIARSVHESQRYESAALVGEQRANDQLGAVLKASGIGIWSYDAEGDTYRADARVHEIMGSTGQPADLIPAGLWRAQVVPEDLPALVALLTRLNREGGSDQQSLRVRTHDGALRHLDITCIANAQQSDGSFAITGLVLDRTTEREAEAARVAATEALTERLKELRLLHAASRLLRPGRPLDASLLHALMEMIPPAFLHPDRTVVQLRCGGTTAQSEAWRTTRWSLTQPIACSNPAGELVVGYLEDAEEDRDPFLPEERELLASLAEMLEAFVARDQAERLRNSLEHQLRQSQKMEALGTLAGGIAHDFNNILTAISGNLALARAEVGSRDPLLEPLDELERATARASDLVRRILLFSRKQDVAMRSIRLAAVVDEVAKLLRASTPPRIQVSVTHAPDAPRVLADESQLHQVLVNLGTNGIFAMGDGDGDGVLAFETDTMTVRSETSSDEAALVPGRYLRLVVRDTGAGINPEILDRLFDPFFTTKGSAGTGLGLAVVHGVVQSHGGQISVESVVGKGTAFTILLPAHEAAPSATPIGPTKIERGRGDRVLYVDDEEAIVFVMSKMLRSIGYQCEGFTSPVEALQAFRTTPHGFDVVVSDFSMPLMSGTSLARELQGIRPGIPVIVSSGYAADEIETGPETGVQAVIPKPVSIVELSHALAGLLGRQITTPAASPPGPAPR
jgi:signal transduction histidine kinase/ActR/RegA family two-component response regulator